ncbi:GH3 family domain-containing protein [Acuticoccus mangrovi]|uniref:GH3 auxin-responsive promoter family protein n=1 Tax=Acuticoccus mangrovi TaxID=2796142 RepID=A0A934MHX6_9HYPH|nr:GH3 auxin-responsive promoter family protein [Acuticoccus mangrovi]MBJ3778153.1 GH3 auxin-responsive promoter family protein [Acuticoccus mangrovi]
MSAAALERTIRVLCGPDLARLRRALDAPEAAQARVAQAVARDLARTEYGRRHGVSSTDGRQTLLDKLPVAQYEDLRPLVARQIAGERAVLTTHPVQRVEYTSGSSGAAKPVPMTAPLIAAFSRTARLMFADALGAGLTLRTGRLFASISPPAGRPDDATSDDTGYLTGLLRPIARHIMVLPPDYGTAQTVEAFRDSLALTLLSARDLEVVSVWSPSYLLALLDHIVRRRDALAHALDPDRAALLARAEPDWTAIWPFLSLLSCWTHGAAARLAAALADRLPGVTIAPKGLLATEGPVTVPLRAYGAVEPVPLVDTVLLEFLDDDGRSHPVHRLDAGGDYDVVTTIPGGLPRYRLGDRVRACERIGATPSLVFLGRAGEVADLVGEKLSADFLRAALDGILADVPSPPLVVVPVRTANGGAYHLLVDASPDEATLLADRLEGALSAAVHYRAARRLGQLEPLRARSVPHLSARLQRFHMGEGMRLGDIKDQLLVTDPDRAAALIHSLGATSPNDSA